MSTVRCVSSRMMSDLLEWRNPHGSETTWTANSSQRLQINWKSIGKVPITHAALLILTISSLVETVAYATLALASFVLYPITKKPYDFFAKHLLSSSFSVLWTLASMGVNLTKDNIWTHESFARYWANGFSDRLNLIYRLEDSMHVKIGKMGLELYNDMMRDIQNMTSDVHNLSEK